MNVTLESYEFRDIKPAFRHASLIALLAALVTTAILAVVPYSGWADDRPVTVTGRMLLAELISLRERGLPLEWITADYDIYEQLQVRMAGVVVAITLAALVAFVIRWAATPPTDGRRHYSGREFIRGRKATLGAASEMLSKAKRKEKTMPLLGPGVPWPRGWQVLNLLILGAIGSGKTRILLGLIEQFLRQVTDTSKDVGLLIYDATGEILAGLPADDSDIAVISATRNAGHAWAMSKDIETLDDCESVAVQRAAAIRETGVWGQGALTLDAGAMVLAGVECKSWSAPELYDICLRDPLALKRAWEVHYPPAAKLIEFDAGTGELSKTSVSFLITWRTNVLRTLRPLAVSWKNIPPDRMFSFSAWLRASTSQPRIVVLERSGRNPDISASWVSMAMDAITGHVGDPAFPVSQIRQRIFLVDEAPTLGRLERWAELLDTGRNKGVVTVAVCQDVPQLRRVYKDMADSILQRFRLRIICQQVPGPGAKEIARDWIGTRRTRDWRSAPVVKGIKETPPLEESEIVPHEHLSDRLGVMDGAVHAVLVGLSRVYLLEWPITVWKRRR